MYESILDPAAIVARVKAGAEWLDRNEPKWFERINTQELDMSDACGCVGGQLGGNYWRFAINHRWLTDYEGRALGFESVASTIEDPDIENKKAAVAREYDLLGYAFLAEIANRLDRQAVQIRHNQQALQAKET